MSGSFSGGTTIPLSIVTKSCCPSKTLMKHFRQKHEQSVDGQSSMGTISLSRPTTILTCSPNGCLHPGLKLTITWEDFAALLGAIPHLTVQVSGIGFPGGQCN